MRAATALVVLSLAAGCSGDNSLTAAARSPVGNWNLQLIGGQGLPYLAYDGAEGRVELTAERLVINQSTFTLYDTYRQTIGGVVTMVPDSLVGWATVTDSSARLINYDAGIDVSGTVNGAQFTVGGDVPFVYARR